MTCSYIDSLHGQGQGKRSTDKAVATRGRIIAAAETEFAAHGYHGATIADIATRAGVAPQTVYFTFNTKAKLMSAVIDRAVMGDDPHLPESTDWWSAMIAEPSAEPRSDTSCTVPARCSLAPASCRRSCAPQR